MLDGMWVKTMVLMRPTRLDNPGGDREGEGRQHPGPEEEEACGAQRQIEPLEEPEREQRLNDETAGECVEAEQGGQSVDDVPRRPESPVCAAARRWRLPGYPGIEQAAGDAQCSIEHEHRLDGRQLVEPGSGQKLRGSGSERPEGGAQRTDQAVPREHAGATLIGRLVAENRVLERNEDADAARRGIDRPGKCDNQQQRKIMDHRVSDTGRDHQHGAGEQQPLPIMA